MVMEVKGGHVTSDLFFTHHPPPPNSVSFPCPGAGRTRAQDKNTGFVADLNRPIRKKKYFDKPRPHTMLSKVLKIARGITQSNVIGFPLAYF